MRGISREDQNKACVHCGRLFATRVNGQTICTKECAATAARAVKRAQRIQSVAAQLLPCPICGKRFDLRSKASIYCSSNCTKKAWKIRHRERHIVAVSVASRAKKYDRNYLPALARDGGKCTQCGATSVMVHHLDNRGDKCTIVPKNHALDNLVTLCSPCHHALHKLDWAIDEQGLVISSEAFKPLLGTTVIRVSRKDVMPYDS